MYRIQCTNYWTVSLSLILLIFFICFYSDRNIMERLQGKNIFQTVIDNIWKLLVSDISLDGEVKKMIEAQIITENYVTELKKYYYGKHDQIVGEILCYIYAQGTQQEQIFTKLLTILKKSLQVRIGEELKKALGNNETSKDIIKHNS